MAVLENCITGVRTPVAVALLPPENPAAAGRCIARLSPLTCQSLGVHHGDRVLMRMLPSSDLGVIPSGLTLRPLRAPAPLGRGLLRLGRRAGIHARAGQ